MSDPATPDDFLVSPSLDADAFRRLARAWAASVTVICVRRRPETIGPDAPALDGFTATGFLTISIDPPVVLVSAANATRALAILSDADSFAVNLLSQSQREAADVFATPHERRGDPFARIAWAPDLDGSPCLRGALGVFSARVRELYPVGDHTLCLGDVSAIRTTASTDSLLYQNRSYGAFVPLRSA